MQSVSAWHCAPTKSESTPFASTLPVQAMPASDDASVAQTSEAFREKYRHSSHVGSIVRAEILSTTLRLEPFPGGASAD